MVLTALQTNTFFTSNNQMALDQATKNQLVGEGIDTVEDVAVFEEGEFKQLVKNLRKPLEIQDPNNPGQLIRQAPFVLNAKSLNRLNCNWPFSYYCKYALWERTYQVCPPVEFYFGKEESNGTYSAKGD